MPYRLAIAQQLTLFANLGKKKFPKELRVDKGIRTLGLQSHNLAR